MHPPCLNKTPACQSTRSPAGPSNRGYPPASPSPSSHSPCESQSPLPACWPLGRPVRAPRDQVPGTCPRSRRCLQTCTRIPAERGGARVRAGVSWARVPVDVSWESGACECSWVCAQHNGQQVFMKRSRSRTHLGGGIRVGKERSHIKRVVYHTAELLRTITAVADAVVDPGGWDQLCLVSHVGAKESSPRAGRRPGLQNRDEGVADTRAHKMKGILRV